MSSPSHCSGELKRKPEYSNISMLVGDWTEGWNAIHDHAVGLSLAFANRFQVRTQLISPTQNGLWQMSAATYIPTSTIQAPTLAHLPAMQSAPTLLLVHYVPHMYQRQGIAYSLLRALLALRFSETRPTIILYVHENYIDFTSWRASPIALAQRLLLRSLIATVDGVVISCDSWRDFILQSKPSKPILSVPVGSNLPDRSPTRLESRHSLGISEDEFVVADFGPSEPHRNMSLFAFTVHNLQAQYARTTLLRVGKTGSTPMSVSPDLRVIQPGEQSLEEVASTLSAADLFLAPYRDGVSTRRGSLLAAMQHGIPTVGTYAYHDKPRNAYPNRVLKALSRTATTDISLLTSSAGLHLAHIHSPEAFAKSACSLFQDHQQRCQSSRLSRQFYHEHLSSDLAACRIMAWAKAFRRHLDGTQSPPKHSGHHLA